MGQKVGQKSSCGDCLWTCGNKTPFGTWSRTPNFRHTLSLCFLRSTMPTIPILSVLGHAKGGEQYILLVTALVQVAGKCWGELKVPALW